MLVDVIHLRRDVTSPVSSRQRPAAASGASVEDETSAIFVTPEEETDREATEGEVVLEERYLEGCPVTEVAAVFTYAAALDDFHTVVFNPHTFETLHVVPAVLERYAR